MRDVGVRVFIDAAVGAPRRGRSSSVVIVEAAIECAPRHRAEMVARLAANLASRDALVKLKLFLVEAMPRSRVPLVAGIEVEHAVLDGRPLRSVAPAASSAASAASANSWRR